MKNSAEPILDELVQRIVSLVSPLRIIVFGSAIRGEWSPKSDVDLLVVMPDGVHRRKVAQKLYRESRGIGVPFDILVATPEDLERHKDNIGLRALVSFFHVTGVMRQQRGPRFRRGDKAH